MSALHRGLDARFVLTCPRCHARSRLGLIRPARPRCACGWVQPWAAPWSWTVERNAAGLPIRLHLAWAPIWQVAR